MNDFKFIYFEGCPNAKVLRDSLVELKIEFSEIEQLVLESSDPLRNYSSPTILKGDQIIFGKEANGGGCTLGIPSTEELKLLLA